MRNLRKVIGLVALTTLVIGTGLLIRGYQGSNERWLQKISGRAQVRKEIISAEALYGLRLGNDVPSVVEIVGALVEAGKREEARRLEGFLGYCHVQRFLGEETACAGETVRSAIAKAPDDLRSASGWPVETPELIGKLASALTFSLPEQALLQKTVGERDWSSLDLSYDGPGVLRYQTQTAGAYIAIAALNNSGWDITYFRASLTLQVQGTGPVKLDCDSRGSTPFPPLDVLHPAAETVAHCSPLSDIGVDRVVSSLHSSAPAIRLQEVVVREPLVFITDGGEMASPRFTVHPLSGVDLRSRSPDSVELVIGKCGPTGTCPPVDDTASPGSGVALVVYDFFSLNYVLAPLCFGGLLGLAIGGLAQRPGRVGAIVAGVVLLGIVSFFVWVGFSVSRMGHEQQGYGGMALMAFLAVGIAGYALLVAALWAGIRVTGAGFKSA